MEKMKDKLYTKYGEDLLSRTKALADIVPLPEYPRPQMVRDSWLCLNGWWDFAIIRGAGSPEDAEWGRILVPFSPEAPLSGVGQTVFPGDRLLYRRTFTLPEGFRRGRVLLHFGAVDYRCRVTVNGRDAGEHRGGYFAFSLDVTLLLGRENILELEVTDPTDTSHIARGKQRLRRGTIWYTPQSGIWQTVWLESVPESYIASLRILPDIDAGIVRIELDGAARDGTAKIRDGQRVLATASLRDGKAAILFPAYELWSPENPKLYDLEVRAGEDRVMSYFGMRKFSVDRDRDGFARLFLNNRPYFHNGVLDQGYYPDGLLTPPSDEAMADDIAVMKGLGFNMLRKHIKIEPLRWYYHCDRLGMIVWQDMVSGGRDRFALMTALAFLKIPCGDRHYFLFGRQDREGREEYMTDAERTVRHLFNTVSVGMWVPFNESWGQFDGDRIAAWVKSLDGSRTIDRYSGWFDQGQSDFKSLHIYFRPFRVPRGHWKQRGKCLVLSEFGGYSLKVAGHCFISKKDFGYRRFSDRESLSGGYRKLFEEEIIPAIPKGLSASVYTQLTDVEDEVNGILTYDRKVMKIDSVPDMNRKIAKAWEVRHGDV